MACDAVAVLFWIQSTLYRLISKQWLAMLRLSFSWIQSTLYQLISKKWLACCGCLFAADTANSLSMDDCFVAVLSLDFIHHKKYLLWMNTTDLNCQAIR